MSLAIVFSGQGLQQWRHRQEILQLAAQYSYASVLQKIFPELFHITEQQWNDVAYENVFAQKLIYTLQHLRWQVLQEQNLDIDILLGYSLGEVSAFCCSAGLDFQQGFALVKSRAELMSHACVQPAQLLSVQGVNLSQIEPLLTQTNTEISIELSPIQWIVGGYVDDLSQLTALLADVAGCQFKPIQVSIPSHTSLMTSAVAEFEQNLHIYHQHRLSIPILSATQGQKEYQAHRAIEHLAYQINHALNWYTTLNVLQEHQPDWVIEMGSGQALSKMIQQHFPNMQTRAIDDFSQLENAMKWIKQ